MDENELSRLGRETGALALQASRLLAEELSAGAADTKRARELSAILKDMTGLARELRPGETGGLLVTFTGPAEEMSR